MSRHWKVAPCPSWMRDGVVEADTAQSAAQIAMDLVHTWAWDVVTVHRRGDKTHRFQARIAQDGSWHAEPVDS
jgi:hypothetical protein